MRHCLLVFTALILAFSWHVFASAEIDATNSISQSVATDEDFSTPFSTSENSLNTLHFHPRQGQAVFSSDINTSLSDQSSNGTSTTNSHWIDTTLSLAYGVTDSVSFGVADTLGNRSSFTSGAADSNTTSGVTEPAVKFGYRLLGTLEGTRFLTLNTSYSPAQGPSIKAGTNQTGNDLRGGDYTSINLNGVAVQNFNEYSAVLSYNSYGKQDTQGATSAKSIETNPYAYFDFALNYRNHFAERQYVQTSVDLSSDYDSTSFYKSPTPVWQTRHPQNLTPSLSYGLLLSKDVLIYTIYKYSESSSSNLSTSQTTTTTQNSLLVGFTTTF
jgi:hypothetical protein